MNTPRKNFNYISPYANSAQQYPSQSEEYISLDMGGPNQHNSAVSSSEKTPGPYKYYHQNFRNSNSKGNKRNLFNNSYYQQNNRQSFNQQRYGPRNSSERQQQNIRNSSEKRHQNQQNFHNDRKDISSISSYIHPSMTEDPWSNLIQRVRALEKSQISIKEPSLPSDKSSPENSDDDQEVNSGTSD